MILPQRSLHLLCPENTWSQISTPEFISLHIFLQEAPDLLTNLLRWWLRRQCFQADEWNRRFPYMPRTSWSPRTISRSAWRREDWLWLLLITVHGAGWPRRVHPYDTLGVEIVPPRLSFCPKRLHHLPRSPVVQHSLPDFEIDFWTWKATDESVFQMPISQQGHILDLGGEKVHCWIYFSCRVGLTQSSTQYIRGWRWSFYFF